MIILLEIADRSGDLEKIIKIENPTESIVEESLKNLNYNHKYTATIEADNGSYMGIVIGEHNKYVVGSFLAGKGRYILVDSPDEENFITLEIGGKHSKFAAHEFVDLETLLTVAETFFKTGECDRRFEWKELGANC